MVWHAYQLNPRAYLQDCVLFGKLNAWRTVLPWAIINDCINNSSFEYDAGIEAVQLFESRTQHRWINFDDPELADCQCPKCHNVYSIPWTQWDNATAWSKNGQDNFHGDAEAHGFADKNFEATCPNSTCIYREYSISHETLRAAKFLSDCKAVKYRNGTMQGLCLNLNGNHSCPYCILSIF